MALNRQMHDLFQAWMDEARADEPETYNGMFLATANAQGYPSGRIVLLKEFDMDGFVFFTNYHSRKGEELEENPRAAATFWWSGLDRQVRIEGKIEKVTREDSLRYFSNRPLLSRISAFVSDQSRPIHSFEELESRFHTARNDDPEAVSCPEHWGGYRLIPKTIEFWQGKAHRLHERHAYNLEAGEWTRSILQP